MRCYQIARLWKPEKKNTTHNLSLHCGVMKTKILDEYINYGEVLNLYWDTFSFFTSSENLILTQLCTDSCVNGRCIDRLGEVCREYRFCHNLIINFYTIHSKIDTIFLRGQVCPLILSYNRILKFCIFIQWAISWICGKGKQVFFFPEGRLQHTLLIATN